MGDEDNTIKKEENSNDVTIEADENLDDSVVAEESQMATIKKLRDKLKAAITEKQTYLESWQKDKAEFLNARKRDKESNQQFIAFANEGLIAELLPVLESFNMAFANKEAWEKVDKNWRTGVEYIANQLKTTLANAGLKEVDPVGQKFDPMRDEAIEHVPVDDEKKSGIITEVVSKGYELNGKQLKAPRVKVGEKSK